MAQRRRVRRFATEWRPVSHAFTLIELLVVIGIVALLIGILMPVLGRARQSAQTTKCAAHLKNLGAAWAMYTDRYDAALPIAVSLPQPLAVAPPGEVTIMSVLSGDLMGLGVFECPADDRGYYAERATSYEYLPGLAIALDPRNAVKLASIAKLRPEIVPILADADEYHPANVPDPKQTVYYDAHVDWLWDEMPTDPTE